MRITADTNLLVRIVVRDDEAQAQMALKVLKGAETVAIPLPCLCELVWVLESVYRLSRSEIAMAVRMILDRANVIADAAAAIAGLRILDTGGDFADGAIAAAGSSMGGETFVSFDRKAIARLGATGMPALHPSEFS